MAADDSSTPQQYDATIASGGFRLTKERREVYEVLLETRDHPSAVQVFNRVQRRMPTISLATVYNCLETLSQCGLIRQVNFDRGPSRFCPNTHGHAHFICTRCGTVRDVDLPDAAELAKIWQMPPECHVSQYEFSLRGLCRQCASTGEDTILSAEPTTT